MSDAARHTRPLRGRRRSIPATWAGCAAAILIAASVLAADEPAGTLSPTGSLSHSARLRHDRQAELNLAAARQRLEEGRPQAALDLIQAAVDESHAAYLPGTTGENLWRSVSAEADLLAEILHRHEDDAGIRLREEGARKNFDEARRDGNAALTRDLLRKSPWARAALEALFDVAVRELDRGQFAIAAAAFRTIVEHPRADAELRRRAAPLEILALERSGQARAAAARRKAPRLEPGGPASDSAGERWSWIERAQRSVVPAAPRVFPETGVRDRSLTLARPSLDPVWRLEAPVPPEMAALLQESGDALEGQGIPRLPSVLPVVAGSTVVARLLDDVVAVDLSTGRTKWRKPTGSIWSQLSGNLKVLQNDGFADMLSRRLMYRAHADSLYSRLSSDGLRVFGVLEATVSGGSTLRPGGGSEAGPRPNTAEPSAITPAPWNQLAAWDVDTGEELWRLGGPARDKSESNRDSSRQSPSAVRSSSDQEPADNAWARGILFLGPPLAQDFVLYVIGSADGAQALFALHAADGELLWKLPLAETSTEQTQGDVRPLPPACPVTMHDGVLVCPTASGAVIAVDAVRRRPLWAWRYPRDDVGKVRTAAANGWNRQLLYPWWETWRDVGLFVAGDRVALTGPDTNAIHMLDLRTGRRLWSRPRGEALFLAAMDRANVVVAGETSVECFDVENGNRRWSTRVSPISGRGAADAGTLYLPLARGGMSAIRLDDGRVQTWPGGLEPAGNLVGFPGGLIAMTLERMTRLDPLESRLAVAREAAHAPNAEVAATLRWARLLRESGAHSDAVAAAESARRQNDDETSRKALRELLTAWIIDEPERAESLAAKIEPLIESPEERVQALDVLGNAHVRAGNPLEALDAWTRLLELNPAGERGPSDDPRPTNGPPASSVRFDRHVQAEITDLLSRAASDAADSDTPASLREWMDRALDHAVGSADPFALQRFADHYGSLPWGRLVRVRQSARSAIGASFVKSQLALLDLASHDDRSLAAAAWRRYAGLMDDRSWRVDAAFAYRRLRDEFGETPCDGTLTGRQAVAAIEPDSLLGRHVAGAPRDPWPAGKPKITSSGPGQGTDYIPLPMHVEAGSIFERIGVSIDRNGGKLRFHGGDQPAGWDLPLPSSKSMFRTAHPLHRGWALGHFLLVRVGSELFGITPFNDQGEPKASLVWRLDMFGGRTARWNQLGVRVAPSPAGFGLDEVVLVDRFGRDLGRVGPVAAGYLCYRDEARLVAIETATGSKLWERRGLPADAVVAGSAEHVVIGRAGEPEVELIRVVDGSTVRRQWIGVPADRVLDWHAAKGLALDGRTLTLIDFTGGRRLWERPLADRALPFSVDDRHCGVLEMDGMLHVIDLVDGATRNAGRIDVPARIDRIFSTLDETRCYVAVSGPFSNIDNQRLQQERGGFRAPPVSGRLVALSRENGGIEWNIPHGDASLPHEQPRGVPFLVIQHWRAGDGANGAETPVEHQRLIDKRTGAEIHHSMQQAELGWYVVEPNIDQRRIELRDTQQTLRLVYGE